MAAGWPFLFAFGRQRPRATQPGRWALSRMRAFVLLSAVSSVLCACQQSERLSFPASPFPPKTAGELRKWLATFVPMEIASATDIHGARVHRSSVDYSNLETFFFAYRCSAAEADHVIPRRQNFLIVDPYRVTVQKDVAEKEGRPVIMPSNEIRAAPQKQIPISSCQSSHWSTPDSSCLAVLS